MEKANKTNYYHYNKQLKNFATANRKKLTKSAAVVWKYSLSRRQMRGYKFRKERPILNYIVDFVCIDLKLIIEIDGLSHLSEVAQEKDLIRDKQLKHIGFHTLRFSSWEVLNRLCDVEIRIGEWIDANAIVAPPPPRKLRVSRKRKSD